MDVRSFIRSFVEVVESLSRSFVRSFVRSLMTERTNVSALSALSSFFHALGYFVYLMAHYFQFIAAAWQHGSNAVAMP